MRNVIWLSILWIPFLIGFVFSFFFTYTAQIIVGIPIIIYWLWAKTKGFEDSDHVLWSFCLLFSIAGMIIGDIIYLIKDAFHISMDMPQLLR